MPVISEPTNLGDLRGEFMTGVGCLVSPEFFDALTSHSAVVKMTA